MKVIKRDLDTDIEKLTIIPISDVHIGDKTANIKAFKEVLERIKNEPNTYTILNGDLCNVALKNSKSDVYSDELTPMEQVLQIISFLEPIKDKILVMSNGNHENRITNDTSIDILYLVAKQLRIDNTLASDVNAFKTWLSTHNTNIYYPYATPTYTKITGTFANQLEALWNSKSKDGQTNLSQVNNDLSFILNTEALEDLS